jgi:hypothetical protein
LLILGWVVQGSHEREQADERQRVAATKAAMAAAEARKKEARAAYCREALTGVLLERARVALKAGSPELAVSTIDECQSELRPGPATELRARAAVAAERADLVKRKREGVRIGMTQEDVLKSSWGRPRRVNRTTTARGVDEQWVYEGGYLYFSDGILRTVQH